MTDFNITNAMDVLTQTVFGGNTLVAGMAFLLVAFLVIVAIFSKLNAPPVYSLVPMIPVVIMFGYLGIVDGTVSMLIVIISVVIVAMYARKMVAGGSE